MSHPKRPSPLVGDHEADLAVLGAGLAGLATALELARPGLRIALVDGSSVGAGAPGADLGHIVTGLGLPYTRAVARFGHEEARTLWGCHRESHERLRERLPGLADDCGYRKDGAFVLARDRAEALELAESEDALREAGFPGEFLDHYMLEARFVVRGFTGAYWSADDGEVEPVALLRALADTAVARGVRLFEASPLVGLTADGSGVVAHTARGRLRAPAGVLTPAASAESLWPGLRGWLAPIEAHQLVSGAGRRPSSPSPARTVDGSLAWRLGRDFRAAAFAAPGAPGTGEEGFHHLARALQTHLGDGPEPLGRWAGTLTAGVDGLPLIGPLAGTPLVAVLGLGALEHSWAFVAARWAAEALGHGGDPAPPLLRTSRFGPYPPEDPA